MLFINASLLCLLGGTIVALWLNVRRQRFLEQQHRQLSEHFSQLHRLLITTRHELSLLTTAVQPQPPIAKWSSSDDALSHLEGLQDPASLADHRAIELAANHIAQLPSGIPSDLFEADQKLLNISRLLDRGHSPSQIAHHLHLPLGEVELLTSLRPASREASI